MKMYKWSQWLFVVTSVCGGLCGVFFGADLFTSDLFLSYFPVTPSTLTVVEENLLLNSLLFTVRPPLSHSNETTLENNRRKIAFCCSADLDVSVDAIQLMEKLKRNVTTTSSSFTPQHFERIASSTELIQSFLYYFQQGAAAEQAMDSLADFKQIVALADTLPNVVHNVGGNAATMAQRAALEGIDVLLGASMGPQMKKRFHKNIKLAIHDHDDKYDYIHEDIHLVLEYKKNQAIFNGDIKSPRANRYYLNHDIHNARLSSLENFEKALDDFKAQVVVIGGIQLMEVDHKESRRIKRLTELSTVLTNLYITKKTKAHYEFAAVSDFTLFNDTVHLILPWVNSIGLNEQELFILHHYLVNDGEEATATSSRPTVANVTKQLADVISYASKASALVDGSTKHPLSSLDRIHFHTLQFHIICQKKKSTWGDPKKALINAALVCTKLACGNKVIDKHSEDDLSLKQMRQNNDKKIEDIQISPERVELLLPRKFLLHKKQNLEVEIDPHSPVSTWEEGDFTCHLVPMLACKKPDHTAGLGDNISGAGLAYHLIEE